MICNVCICCTIAYDQFKMYRGNNSNFRRSAGDRGVQTSMAVRIPSACTRCVHQSPSCSFLRVQNDALVLLRSCHNSATLHLVHHSIESVRSGKFARVVMEFEGTLLYIRLLIVWATEFCYSTSAWLKVSAARPIFKSFVHCVGVTLSAFSLHHASRAISRCTPSLLS